MVGKSSIKTPLTVGLSKGDSTVRRRGRSVRDRRLPVPGRPGRKWDV